MQDALSPEAQGEQDVPISRHKHEVYRSGAGGCAAGFRLSQVGASLAAGIGLLPAGFRFTRSENDEIRPFRVDVPEDALADLRQRVAATRLPDRETVDDGSQGLQLAAFRNLCATGPRDYDWRKAEARLNALPQFITDDRRHRHPLHPCALASSERPAADHDARLAGFGVRAAQDRRSSDRSDEPRRTRRRRIRSRSAVDPRLRLFRQAQRYRMGPGAHRTRLGRTDESPRLRRLRRPGRRLGRADLQRDGTTGSCRIARHPHQPAGGRAVRDRRAARHRRACSAGPLERNVQRSTHSPSSTRSTGPTPQ